MQRFLLFIGCLLPSSPFFHALLNVSEFSSFQHLRFFLTRSKEKSVLDGFFVPEMKREVAAVAAKRSVMSPFQKQYKAALYVLILSIYYHIFISIDISLISGWWSIQMSQIQRQGKVLIGPGFNIDGNDVESTDNMIESKRFCCLLPFNHTGKLTHQLLVIWFNNVVQLFVSLKPFIRLVILAFLHLGAEQ